MRSSAIRKGGGKQKVIPSSLAAPTVVFRFVLTPEKNGASANRKHEKHRQKKNDKRIKQYL